MPPPPPLLSRDPGALRLITFPDTTWPSAAARRSASRLPNRLPPTLRSGLGLRRKPRRRRRRRRRAGEADGRSGFRLSPQRRTRRRERLGEEEAEEGTYLPGPCVARNAGAQQDADGEEAVAVSPHALSATASPPPGSARRAAAAARHAGNEGRCRSPPSLGRGAWSVRRVRIWWAWRRKAWPPSQPRASPSRPAYCAAVWAPPRRIMGEGIPPSL